MMKRALLKKIPGNIIRELAELLGLFKEGNATAKSHMRNLIRSGYSRWAIGSC